ncbi:hypothetical protein [Amycolatopsis sp. lyj-109]|uniref:hypothetical protein n=1 Tax=Amycolatopsis sp. lyj-109 TaxID=2789287 RepID=UPI00397CF364
MDEGLHDTTESFDPAAVGSAQLGEDLAQLVQAPQALAGVVDETEVELSNAGIGLRAFPQGIDVDDSLGIVGDAQASSSS